MEQTFLAKVVLPASLFIIMLGMGLSLVMADFKRVLKFPKAFAVGLCCQLLLLPAIGFLVISLVKLDSPELAVGLLVLTFCPGGATSNMLTYLARGNVALSISLTAVVSFIAPFTIPLLTAFAMRRLMGEAKDLPAPLVVILQLFAITIVPVVIGMVLKAKKPELAGKAEKPVKIFSIIALLAIIAGLIKQNWEKLPEYFAQTGVAAVLLNVIAMACGFFIAKGFRLKRGEQITVSMEVGIQNGTTALLVTGTLIGNQVMTIAPAIYSLVMFATGGLFGYIINIGREREGIDDAPEPASPDAS